MSIRTILFDLDGTLIDTNTLIKASFEHTFKEYNLNFSNEEILKFNGPPLVDTFNKIDETKADRMITTFREHNIREHDNFVTAFPHVYDTLEELQNRNISLGIVSTKMRHTVHMGLELTGISKFFSTIITYDDVTHAKPHPEPVQMAMQKLGAHPEHTLMVGDNHHDIVSGQRANVQTAAVAWSLKDTNYLKSFHPDYIIEDMKDIITIVGDSFA
ncbi:pyrophosphatase PpaX [Oceanobacillus iheyensis]|uniref:pyrophosphatase PpaX n=1 Tax=Oceanobacillus iheyensis TaxID=182710 RepID=UPI00363B2286